MQNPPDGWRPGGWTPTASQTSQRAGHDYTLSEALKTWQWYALWLLLFLNTCAGIPIISQEAWWEWPASVTPSGEYCGRGFPT